PATKSPTTSLLEPPRAAGSLGPTIRAARGLGVAAAMSTEQIPVWLDCDPGHDDAFAILLAAHHPRIKLLGISTVFGNASLERTTHNAASVLTALGRHEDVPLYAGLGKALERPALHAPTDIHGDSGLDGTDLLPAPACAPR
ncbi:Uridine nucleosidase, partial [Tolypocladium capitatum]